jgi:NAD+--asparagine ADP-ribosyltransferase
MIITHFHTDDKLELRLEKVDNEGKSILSDWRDKITDISYEDGQPKLLGWYKIGIKDNFIYDEKIYNALTTSEKDDYNPFFQKEKKLDENDIMISKGNQLILRMLHLKDYFKSRYLRALLHVKDLDIIEYNPYNSKGKVKSDKELNR